MTGARAFLGRVRPDGSNYLELMQEGLRYIRFGEGLPSTPRVFVKPNLTFPYYRPGVMTSPEAVEAMIVALRDYTPHVWVGDSDSGGYNRFCVDDVYEATGVREFASRHGVAVVNLSTQPRTTVRLGSGRRAVALELPRLLTEEIDLLLTMPVPKVHVNTGVSLTLKNQWGCIPETSVRLRLHPRFSDIIVPLNRAVHARYAAVDGRFGLNGSGPLRGDPVELGWVCVTDDVGAGARVACELMQVRLESVRHLRRAAQLGAIPALDDIETNAELREYRGPPFAAKKVWTDIPGYLAFHNRALAHLAYFSRWAEPLHRLLYRFREPFYDYEALRK